MNKACQILYIYTKNNTNDVKKMEMYRDTSSQVLFRRWMALHCRAERMARNEEKFFKIRHSWTNQQYRTESKLNKPFIPAFFILTTLMRLSKPPPAHSPEPHLSTSPAAGLSGWASASGCSGRWWWRSWWQNWTGPQWLWWWEPGAPSLSYPAGTKCRPGSAPPSWTDPEQTARETKREV